MFRRRGLPVLLLLGGALLLLPGLSASPAHVAATPFSSYDTGAVHVVLPTAVPRIQLAQDANASVNATLTLDRIYELRDCPGGCGDTGAGIAAVAFPTEVRTYSDLATTNSTSSGTTGGQVLLSANLTVFRWSGLLFPPVGVNNPMLGAAVAPTSLQVTVTTQSSDRVAVAASISGWPWLSQNDWLAVAWGFTVPGAAGFAGCAGSSPASVPRTACGVSPFQSDRSAWSVAYAGLEGVGGSGPLAQLSWGSSGAAGPIGLSQGAPNSTTLVQSSPSRSNASAVNFQLAYALAVPPLPQGPAVLHGAIAPFVGGAVSAAILGSAGVLYARRRERRLLDAL